MARPPVLIFFPDTRGIDGMLPGLTASHDVAQQRNKFPKQGKWLVGEWSACAVQVCQKRLWYEGRWGRDDRVRWGRVRQSQGSEVHIRSAGFHYISITG